MDPSDLFDNEPPSDENNAPRKDSNLKPSQGMDYNGQDGNENGKPRKTVKKRQLVSRRGCYCTVIYNDCIGLKIYVVSVNYSTPPRV